MIWFFCFVISMIFSIFLLYSQSRGSEDGLDYINAPQKEPSSQISCDLPLLKKEEMHSTFIFKFLPVWLTRRISRPRRPPKFKSGVSGTSLVAYFVICSSNPASNGFGFLGQLFDTPCREVILRLLFSRFENFLTNVRLIWKGVDFWTATFGLYQYFLIQI